MVKHNVLIYRLVWEWLISDAVNVNIVGLNCVKEITIAAQVVLPP